MRVRSSVAAAESLQFEPSRVMHVRCPKCDSSIAAIDSSDFTELFCEFCGEEIKLVEEETETTALSTEAYPQISQFRLIEPVGKGGFGIVWRAEDTLLDRIVAIKTPRPGVIAPSESNQFIREAQATARLKHPNIVSVHEVGRVDEGIYIVSDFIDGMTLYQWMHRNEPRVRQAAEFCATIADAIEHAHSAGVIHRDIKPGNILLDSDETPYVADFGLAQRQFGDTTMTLDGRIVGTPSYMSPEQALGERVDGRTDIYSIGVLLFELLTGTRPFLGSRNRLIRKVIEEDPVSPRRLNGSVPRDLDTICLKCLEKDPNARYASAGDLRDDLRRFLGNQPICARPVNRIERMVKWARRRPLVASLLSLVVVATVAGVSGISWQWQRVLASQRRHADTQIKLILDAEPTAVLSAIDGLAEFREWSEPELQRLVKDESLSRNGRFRSQLALVEQHPEYIPALTEQLLSDQSLQWNELSLGVQMLSRIDALPIGQLNELAVNTSLDDTSRFRALFILAMHSGISLNSATTDWSELAPYAAEHLVINASNSPRSYRVLVDAFRSTRSDLVPSMIEFLFRERTGQADRITTVSILGEYLSDRVDALCDLILRVRGDQYSVLLPRVKSHSESAAVHLERILAETTENMSPGQDDVAWLSRKASAAITLLHLDGEPAGVWELFRQSPDPTLRTLLIHRCASLELPPERIAFRLAGETEQSIRQALLLTLGEYDNIPAEVLNHLRPRLEDWFRSDPDPGIHAAVAWLLRSWGQQSLVDKMESEPAFSGIDTDRRWYVNSQGATMVVIDHPPVFRMGSPADEPMRTGFDRIHLRKVDRKFAIGMTEVTWDQYKKFLAEYSDTNHRHPENYGPDPHGPALAVSWVQAAKYCRWLSEKEGFDEDQMCFPPLDKIDEEVTFSENLLERTGYRLPTEGEWECACRCGTTTMRFFGRSDEFLSKYGWHIGNSNDYAYRVGLLKPNDYGLFDVYGNAWEWCLDRHGSLPKRPPGTYFLDAPKLVGTKPRILRGGSMNSRTTTLRSAQRDYLEALHNRNHNVGFRLVRTLAD